MSIQQEKFKAIADKIRSILGVTGTIAPNDFAQHIDTVAESRYEKGHMDGYFQGKEEGETAGIEQGKQTAYDEFWDDFQNKGGATGCAYLFSGTGAWNMNLYKPKYNWYATYTAAAMFQGATWLTDTIVNLNFTDATMTNIGQLFQGCTNLVNARTIILPKFSVGMDYSFYNCQKLQEVRFSPKVTRSSLITMPFNEAFYIEEGYPGQYFLNDSIYDTYATYCAPGNVSCEGAPASYPVTCVCFEDGTKITFWKWCQQPFPAFPDWFIPEDETQNVSFYLENPSTECIYRNISFAESSVLSKDSIISIFKALALSATDKKLTLNKKAVNTAFNIDVDTDENAWGDYLYLVQARPNWTISYA